MNFKRIQTITLVIGLLAMVSCKETIYVDESEIEAANDVQAGEGLADWTTETHTIEAGINYDVVFPQNQVNRIDIVLTSAEYNSMRSNLASLSSRARGGDFPDDTPVYVACDFYFNGVQWYDVGVRYKGNSSLYGAYSSGNGKLPLRIKFDEFEDDNPAIKNQRFYGFQHLSLCSNYNDESFMREKSATDLFTDFGVPTVQTSFYQVYVDQGTGTPVYYGLYTLDEVVFDTMLASTFGSNTGNCYKPDGDGAQFASSRFTLDDFEKKTNDEQADWSDIQELYNVLHSSLRTTDEATWKSNLESVFDVQGFLKYLAVNNTIQNWDTYANMSHNYYLYHDPADNLIKWIVWDNNEAFSNGNRMSAVSLGMSEVGSDWPLISYLIAVDSYKEDYQAYLKDFNDNYYTPTKMETYYSTNYNLIYPSATTETNGYTHLSGNASSAFTSAVEELKEHCTERNSAVSSYLR